jgi:pyrroloquinoline-quinone synthase
MSAVAGIIGVRGMDNQIARLETSKRLLIEITAAHSFLSRCRQQIVPLDELKLYLVQEGLYGQYFTRYLCATMASLPNNEAVLTLAANLSRELGFSPRPHKPHHLMYREMLERFGLTLEGAEPLPATQGLIDTMFKACRNLNPATGLGAFCLGSESLVPVIYSAIVAGLAAHTASDGDVEFFQMHVDQDDGREQAIRELMAELASGRSDQIDKMLQAGQQLVSARLDFFSSIEEAYGQQALPDLMLVSG